MPNAKIEKWRGWCEDRLRVEVSVMHLHRHVVRTLSEIAAENDLPRSYFWQYLRDTYTATQASAIRRQVDTRRDVCSLAHMLAEVSQDHTLISKRLYIDNHDAEERAEAERRFAEKFAGEDANYVDPEMVKSDLDLLALVGERVKGYVHEYIAHSPPEITRGAPGFPELDFAIDGISDLLNKYSEAITGKTCQCSCPRSTTTGGPCFACPGRPSSGQRWPTSRNRGRRPPGERDLLNEKTPR
jgi:hypothetical protein